MKDEEIARLQKLLDKDICHCHLETGKDNLYIRTEVFHGADSALVEIAEKHTYITRIERTGTDTVSGTAPSS
ncbi:hypothetical protein FYJ34_11560 [Clostridiaceae bacterium 68-1-5]|uniref:Uncharacterized protein n=1 Tax=Suipraeoptans intestinalis TaxID=2606628 RepID=A0A6N7V2S9_9FIRM|nr:hypothetical protein [Suipraeoptans intestinalis]MSR94865.1 hypothetical protein [Suipraeoptans intestinalis]